MLELDVGIPSPHVRDDLAPEPRRLEDIGLVDRGDETTPSSGSLEGHLGDALNFWSRVAHGIEGRLAVIRHAARTAGFFKVRGINVNQADIEDFMHRQDAISDFKIEAIETDTLDALRVSDELRLGAEATDETQQLSRSVKSIFELTPEVVVLELGTLEREFSGQVKQVRFIDRRS